LRKECLTVTGKRLNVFGMATQTTFKKIRNQHKKLTGTTRLAFIVADTLAADIDAYGLHTGCLTRNEAIVVLVRKGLEHWKAPLENAEATAKAMKGTMKEIISEVVAAEREAERGLK